MAKITDQDAREYHHLNGKPGKIAVIPTKPMDTQRDLGLAYTPGVAVPVLDIEKDPEMAYEYHIQRQPGGRFDEWHGHPGPG